MMKRDTLSLQSEKTIREVPFPSWPAFAEDEIKVAAEVLASGKVNYWTGNQGRLFEEEFARKVGCSHGVSVANGTAALEAALNALEVKKGDEVIVPARTFVATAGSVVACGARPVFADVDRDSQNVAIDTIKPLISGRTKAIIIVHLAGWPCDTSSIMRLAAEHGIHVVEDCAQSHGAAVNGRAVGSLGDIAVFSFCQDKIMTTGGEGGMVVTDDERLWKKTWSYRDHGKDYDKVQSASGKGAGFVWLHDSFGSNLRMTEMQSAIGRVQLGKLDDWVNVRRSYAECLNAAFSGIPALRVTIPPDGFRHSYYKYYVFIRPEMLKEDWNRDSIVAAVNAEGIPCFTGSCPEVYRELSFVSAGLAPQERLPGAKEVGETSLMFLVHPALEEGEIADTIGAVEKVLEAASA